MEAFTAKGINEEWVITRNAHILDKLVCKTTKQAVVREHTTITYLDGGKALPAFYAEKRKASSKGLEISNFDSTVEKPKIDSIKVTREPRGTKVFGRYVPLEI